MQLSLTGILGFIQALFCFKDVTSSTLLQMCSGHQLGCLYAAQIGLSSTHLCIPSLLCLQYSQACYSLHFHM